MEQQNEYEWGESPEKTEAEIAEDIRKKWKSKQIDLVCELGIWQHILKNFYPVQTAFSFEFEARLKNIESALVEHWKNEPT